MPFGSADRAQLQQITKQLSDLAAEIAAIRQQVADQQHTIDQSRRDATAAITNGLAEVRAVARDAMTRTTDLVTGPLTQINSELVAVRSALAQIDGQLKTQASTTPASPAATSNEPAFGPAPEPPPTTNLQPTPEPEPAAPEPAAPEPAPKTATEPADHPEPDPEILRAAAGISAATLHAHRDTWEFLVKHAGRDQHFHLPAEVQDASGTILAKVSGPSIVAALTSLHHVAHTADDAGTRAIAAHLHERLTETVQDIVTRPHRGDGAEPTRIVIDDRAKDADPEEPPTSP